MKAFIWAMAVGSCLIAGVANAAPQGGTSKATALADDPTGTWKWTVEFNGQSRETTLKLKLADGKLTGAMVGRNNQETAIENGAIKDGEITFTVTRERNNQKMTSSYKGKLSGDEIKGTIESERDGQKRSREWTAKRSKE